MQAQAGTRPRPGARRCQRRRRMSGVIEKSADGSANSLRIRRAAAYTARSSVASPKSRTTFSFGRGRKERQAGRFSASMLRPPQAQGKPGQAPPRTMPGTGDATGTDAGMSTTDPQEADKAAGNGRRAGRETTVAAVRGAHPAMFRRIHPAILLKQTRLVPRFRSPEQELPRAHKKGVPQNRSSAERPTVTTQGLPGASIAPSPTG